jgi:hypothetical protein
MADLLSMSGVRSRERRLYQPELMVTFYPSLI